MEGGGCVAESGEFCSEGFKGGFCDGEGFAEGGDFGVHGGELLGGGRVGGVLDGLDEVGIVGAEGHVPELTRIPIGHLFHSWRLCP